MRKVPATAVRFEGLGLQGLGIRIYGFCLGVCGSGLGFAGCRYLVRGDQPLVASQDRRLTLFRTVTEPVSCMQC